MEYGPRDPDNYIEVFVDEMQKKIEIVNTILSLPMGRLKEAILIGIDDEGEFYLEGTPSKELSLQLLKKTKKFLKEWDGIK